MWFTLNRLWKQHRAFKKYYAKIMMDYNAYIIVIHYDHLLLLVLVTTTLKVFKRAKIDS